MSTGGQRNLRMAERISAAPVRYPCSFVVAGDSGAWPDPTADAIFAQLLKQTARLRPAPLFFANLGDFAGPGTPERHEHYLRTRRHPLRRLGRRRHRPVLAFPRRLRGWGRAPEDRGALFHAVEITITEAGAISGRVLQAFDPVDGHARLHFGDT